MAAARVILIGFNLLASSVNSFQILPKRNANVVADASFVQSALEQVDNRCTFEKVGEQSFSQDGFPKTVVIYGTRICKHSEGEAAKVDGAYRLKVPAVVTKLDLDGMYSFSELRELSQKLQTLVQVAIAKAQKRFEDPAACVLLTGNHDDKDYFSCPLTRIDDFPSRFPTGFWNKEHKYNPQIMAERAQAIAKIYAQIVKNYNLLSKPDEFSKLTRLELDKLSHSFEVDFQEFRDKFYSAESECFYSADSPPEEEDPEGKHRERIIKITDPPQFPWDFDMAPPPSA